MDSARLTHLFTAVKEAVLREPDRVHVAVVEPQEGVEKGCVVTYIPRASATGAYITEAR